MEYHPLDHARLDADAAVAAALVDLPAARIAEVVHLRDPDVDAPRPSIAERYATREDYLARVRDAARALAKGGYLLEEDVETSAALAARMWDAWA